MKGFLEIGKCEWYEMNYFLRKYSIAAKRNPATEMVVVIAAMIPSNSLYVFRYATINPMQVTLRKISKESILSNFFLHFSGDHSSGSFNQNVSPKHRNPPKK